MDFKNEISKIPSVPLNADMGCIAFKGTEGILEISFLKSTGIRKNFSLKSIYTGAAIPVENMIKIGV